MNSVIAGERWIASQGWEGIARAGKINPWLQKRTAEITLYFLCLGRLFALSKRAARAPRSHGDNEPCWAKRKLRQKNSI